MLLYARLWRLAPPWVRYWLRWPNPADLAALDAVAQLPVDEFGRPVSGWR